MSDGDWWLHLYVMFSRVTQMSHPLLLRPPPRQFLERGPPPHLQGALRTFAEKAMASRVKAEALADSFAIAFPPSS